MSFGGANNSACAAYGLRLVRPPRDYARIGEMIVRMAELAAAYHAAQSGQATRGCTPVREPVGPRLKLVRDDAGVPIPREAKP